MIPLESILDEALHTPASWSPLDGLFPYPAGLSPAAASILLDSLPPGPVLDPFIGGGTVALVGRRSGRQVYGRDLSPAAISISRARLWRPSPAERDSYSAHVEAICVMAPDLQAKALQELPEPLRSAVAVTISTTHDMSEQRRQRLTRRACELWQHEDHALPCDAIAPIIQRLDARRTPARPRVSAVLTSPPYPGVFNYGNRMKHLLRLLGQAPHIDGELGRRGTVVTTSADSIRAWESNTEAWMRSVTRAVKPHGWIAIVIGDGPSPTGPIDARAATETIAAGLGLRMIAAMTARPECRPSPRIEHALLFEVTQKSGTRAHS